MLQDAEAYHAYLRRSEPFGVGSHVWRDNVLPISRTAKLRPAKTGREHGAISAAALLYHWVRASHIPRQPAIPRTHRLGPCPSNVRRQEHDGGVRPASRTVLDGSLHIPWPHVNEGGGRGDVQGAVQ